MNNSADKPLASQATKPSVCNEADSTKDKGNVRLGSTAHILPPASETTDGGRIRLGSTAHLFPQP